MNSCFYQERLYAIRRYLSGEPVEDICETLNKSREWFYQWWRRYKADGPVGLQNLSTARHTQPLQTPEEVQQALAEIRQLRQQRQTPERKYSLIGAGPVRRETIELGFEKVPSVRTTHRILKQHGLISAQSPEQGDKDKVDRHYPYLEAFSPGVAQQIDTIGPRYLKGSNTKYYFFCLKDICSLRERVGASPSKDAGTMLEFLAASWKVMGIPHILQHDNGLEFLGSNRYPHSLSKLTKFVLSQGVEDLFIPPREAYRGGSIENFNGLFQRLVLSHEIRDFEHLQQEVDKFNQICNIEHVHKRLNYMSSLEFEQAASYCPRLLPQEFKFKKYYKLDKPKSGKLSFIRQIRKSGQITIKTEKFAIDENLVYDYVYATIDVKEQKLKIYHMGKLLKEFDYKV